MAAWWLEWRRKCRGWKERERERTSKLEEALQGQTIGPRVTTTWDERVRAVNKATVSHPVCLFVCCCVFVVVNDDISPRRVTNKMEYLTQLRVRNRQFERV